MKALVSGLTFRPAAAVSERGVPFYEAQGEAAAGPERGELQDRGFPEFSFVCSGGLSLGGSRQSCGSL